MRRFGSHLSQKHRKKHHVIGEKEPRKGAKGNGFEEKQKTGLKQQRGGGIFFFWWQDMGDRKKKPNVRACARWSWPGPPHPV